MKPLRPLDSARDVAGVAALIGRVRADGGSWHPGGIQWWLRQLGRVGFEAIVAEARGEIQAFVMLDDTFVIAIESGSAVPTLELIDWAEARLRARALPMIETMAVADSLIAAALRARGYAPSAEEAELMFHLEGEPAPSSLPAGFRFASLIDVSDDAYIALHRASWSDVQPSSYSAEMHDRVRRMPSSGRTW